MEAQLPIPLSFFLRPWKEEFTATVSNVLVMGWAGV